MGKRTKRRHGCGTAIFIILIVVGLLWILVPISERESTGPSYGAARALAKMYVQRQLLAPATANIKVISADRMNKKGIIRVHLQVDGQNYFGAMLRKKYVVDVKYVGPGSQDLKVLPFGDLSSDSKTNATPRSNTNRTTESPASPITNKSQRDNGNEENKPVEYNTKKPEEPIFKPLDYVVEYKIASEPIGGKDRDLTDAIRFIAVVTNYEPETLKEVAAALVDENNLGLKTAIVQFCEEGTTLESWDESGKITNFATHKGFVKYHVGDIIFDGSIVWDGFEDNKITLHSADLKFRTKGVVHSVNDKDLEFKKEDGNVITVNRDNLSNGTNRILDKLRRSAWEK